LAHIHFIDRRDEMKFQISSTISGQDLGTYEASDPRNALDLMARDAGYADYDVMCDTLGWDFGKAISELSIVTVEIDDFVTPDID
jgi:hypothetical protein